MTDKNLYLSKITGTEPQGGNDILNSLYGEIIVMKKELNKKIFNGETMVVNEEIIELSNKLDELIIKYFEV